MFFISRKSFREEVERELSKNIEEREYRMSLNLDFSRLCERIGRLEDRVARLESTENCTPENCTPDLPF